MNNRIENAIEIVNKYLTWSIGSNSVTEEQIELENSLIFLSAYVKKMSKAWEEVVQELEAEKNKSYENFGLNYMGLKKAIKIINQKLSEIEAKSMR